MAFQSFEEVWAALGRLYTDIVKLQESQQKLHESQRETAAQLAQVTGRIDRLTEGHERLTSMLAPWQDTSRNSRWPSNPTSADWPAWKVSKPSAAGLQLCGFPAALHSSVPMPSKHSLELRRQVGQLLVMGFDGTALSAATARDARRLSARRHHPLPAQPGRRRADTCLAERRTEGQRHADVPLRRHGGWHRRSPARCDRACAVGCRGRGSGSKKLFRRHGQLIGEEIRALGFNTDFAPVLDLRLEAVAKRARLAHRLAETEADYRLRARVPARAARLRRSGLRQALPGTGRGQPRHPRRAAVDRQALEALWKEDLAPYRELRRELPFVMVAHAAYPQVTGDNTPASLSKKWMSGILRKKIGYQGLIITDDLDMGGVLAAASIEDAAVETLRAGADMFLVCQKEESVRRAFEAVLKRAESDKKFAKLIAEKVGAGTSRQRRKRRR